MHQLRNQLKKQLTNLTTSYRETAAEEVTTIVTHKEIFISAQHIACYMPIAGEIATRKIIDIIWQLGKHCYLPVCDIKNKILHFTKFTPQTELVTDAYGIPTPTDTTSIITAQDLDLVIAPLLGFNRENFRLGRGAGYYDRTFAYKKNNSTKPYLLGIGYAYQRIEFTPQAWDIPLDKIIAK